MTAYQLLSQKVSYNKWANQLMIHWLKEQSNALYKTQVFSSFPNINKCIHHIMEAKKYYLSILLGIEEQYESDMEIENIFEELLDIDSKLVAWLSLQNEEDVNRIIKIKRSPVLETYSVAEIITHMINHSTYHRGQLIALRHQLDMSEAPKTDYYRYLIASKST